MSPDAETLVALTECPPSKPAPMTVGAIRRALLEFEDDEIVDVEARSNGRVLELLAQRVERVNSVAVGDDRELVRACSPRLVVRPCDEFGEVVELVAEGTSCESR